MKSRKVMKNVESAKNIRIELSIMKKCDTYHRHSRRETEVLIT